MRRLYVDSSNLWRINERVKKKIEDDIAKRNEILEKAFREGRKG